MKMQMKHLSHSGFLVEDDQNIFLFDAITPINLGTQGKNIYVFSSHSHGDHFNLEVIKSLSNQENIQFIFSKDIAPKISKVNINFFSVLDNHEHITIRDVEISTYGSTDLGNSYLVTSNGKSFFHSGDLNWWHWKRMTPAELKVEESDFKKEVDLLKNKSIDFAFIPVDPRLEEYAYLAINYFIKVVHPKYVIPMHSFGQYDFYKDLEKHIDLRNTLLLNVKQENQVIYRG